LINPNSLNPIQPNERIIALDIIRGLAIFGIFLVNMLDFHSPWQYVNLTEWWPLPADRVLITIIDIMVQASFYTLFSMLFGYGLVTMMERAHLKGLSSKRVIFRRLLGLLMIGMIHAFFIWSGDILISYAIVGACYLLFHKTKPKTKLIWALILILIPTLIMGGLLSVAYMLEPDAMSTEIYEMSQANRAVEAYSSGSYMDIFHQRVHDWRNIHDFILLPILIVTLLPMFLIGAYAAQTHFLQKADDNLSRVKKICIWSGILGICFKLFPYLTDLNNVGYTYIQDAIGGPLLAIFYSTALILVLKTRIKKWMIPLAYVGRMSLSNYLFQSIVCTLIFYNYGLGLYGEVRPIYGFGLNIVIFSLQIYLSKLWMERHLFGPAEWVWRNFTYGSRQPLTKSESQEA